MKLDQIMDTLGKTFSEGKTDALLPLLAEDCTYDSDDSGMSDCGAQRINFYIESIYKALKEKSRYSYELVELETVLASGRTPADLDCPAGLELCKSVLLLYQHSRKLPAAVVVCTVDAAGLLKSIRLSRDSSLFHVSFYDNLADLNGDLPSTVKPYTTEDRYAAEMRSSFTGQKRKQSIDTEDGNYIWRKADEYVKQWLPDRGYLILESAVFDDCIGYRCSRKGDAYTVFMYAYGKKQVSRLDGAFCSKLASVPFAENSVILILYLNVFRYMDGNEVKYSVRDYSGSSEQEPELWHLKVQDDRYILEYYPSREMMDLAWQFMYAFNRENTDIYDCIIEEKLTLEGLPNQPDICGNEACYGTLLRLHREYGDMKLGYVRYNDVIYNVAPYIEGLGFFGWRSYRRTNRIFKITCYPFDGGERKIAEFMKTEQREPDDLFAALPKLVAAVPLPPVPRERFAAKVFFNNGECRKYVLPIAPEKESAAVVPYEQYVFRDEIWASASVVSRHESRSEGYPECGPAIVFPNQFYIAGTRCYLESVPYSEPELTDEIVYSNEEYRIRKLWKWNVNSLYEDWSSGLLAVLISGEAFNGYGKSTFVTVDGKRLTSLTFDHLGGFQEGLACVGIAGCGYGFVNQAMGFVIPMKYDRAEGFKDGRAKVRLGDKWIFVNQAGQELVLKNSTNQEAYQEIGDYAEGLCRVSTLKLRLMDIAYYSDYDGIAGIWGFINEAGEEVIPPQYIYANDFEDGLAIVAKGKWTIDPKWDNQHNQGCYWTEEEHWGAIDRDGREVIPFVFDEIKCFADRRDLFMAHYGGWKDGNWGVIDNKGNWLAEPVFGGFDYETWNDLILFYDRDAEDDDALLGVYDLRKKEVLFEPQFLDVGFMDNGDMIIEVFDQKLGREVEKIIDQTGKERFPSVYSSIYTWKEPYEVEIRDESGSRSGLIEKDGSVILPCVHNIAWNGINHKKRRFCFEENGKQGIMDYDGNRLIPAIYYEIHDVGGRLLTVRVGEEDNYKEGMITPEGKPVIPAQYKRIGWCSDHRHFFGCSNGCCEMYIMESTGD